MPRISIPIGPSRAPIWPEGVEGSISHTRGLAVSVAARDSQYRGIGLDVEHVIESSMREVLSSTVVDHHEIQYLQTLDDDLSIEAALTLAFSAKESLFKGTHAIVGHSFGFDKAKVVQVDIEQNTLQLQVAENLCTDYPQGKICTLHFRRVFPDILLTCFTRPD